MKKSDLIFSADPFKYAMLKSFRERLSLDVGSLRSLYSVLKSCGVDTKSIIQSAMIGGSRLDDVQFLVRKHNPAANFWNPEDEFVETLDSWLPESVGDNLLTTWEASPSLKLYARTRNIRHIDMRISPIRFCSELLIRIYSSNLGAPESNLSVKDSVLFESAYAWMENSKQESLTAFEEVFFMQKEGDFSLIGESHWMGTDDAISFIEKRAMASFSKMLGVNLHPFSGLSREAKSRLQAIRNSAMFRLSAYEIMSSKRLRTVISISSSVLEEARYFQKESVGLLPAQRDESARDLTTASLAILLESLGLQSSFKTSSLSESLGFDWSLGDKPSLPKFRSD